MCKLRFSLDNCVRELRIEKGISQQQLANVVGMSRNALASIERGESEPTLKRAYAIALYFGKPIEEVFTIRRIDKWFINQSSF